MASLTLASPCITSTIFNSETSSNYRRDDSFSSYLNLIRENLAKDHLSDSGETPTTMRISIGKNQAADQDGELDIFRAEKYFSGIMDGENNNIEAVMSDKSQVSSYNKEGKMSLKSVSMTESTCSETSANSRNTLLRGHRRKLSSSSSGRRRRTLLGVFRCSCSGKDAIMVEEDMNINGSKNKEEHFAERSSFATKIEDGLTFMTLNSQMAAGRMTIQKETFGSPFIEKGLVVSTFRKSLSFSTSPLTTKQEEEEEEDGGDLLSVTSSDLFEIDSLSINGNPLFRPEITGYEPSEASIDWSVTTASAGNEEQRRLDDGGKRPSKSSKHSMLLGCASEKAVKVTTENIYSKKPAERLSSVSYEQLRFESLPPLLRFHASHAVQSRHSLDFTHGAL